MSENSNRDTRTIKGISFTNAYKEELDRLIQEPNGSKLVCELLRNHYNYNYNMGDLKNDMTSIKDILEDIKKKLVGND